MQDNSKISIVGKVYLGDKLLTNQELQQQILAVSSNEFDFINTVRTWSGYFTVVLEQCQTVYVITDRIRSFPVLIDVEKQKVYLEGFENYDESSLRLEPTQIKSFFFSGYTIGDNTIAKQIISVPAGHIYIVDKAQQEIQKYNYFSFIPNNYRQHKKSTSDYICMFDACYDKVFMEVIERARGRQIVIPLSAGYDSRLVLHYLLKNKYDNIMTFSYGNNKFWELEFAREVAKKAKVPWYQYVSTKRDRKRFFDTPVQKFYWKSFNLEQVPQMNDYYAIEHLMNKRVISPESILINGQSGDFVDGGHIPSPIYSSGNPSDLIQGIIEKHFSLWSESNRSKLGKQFLFELLATYLSGSKIQIADNPIGSYEKFEYLHRQTKLVVNGQRVYDHFGLDWELPLWDQRIMEFWMDVPLKLRMERKLTIEACKKLDGKGLFSIPTQPDEVWKHVPIIIRCLQFLDSKCGFRFNVNQNIANFFGTYSSLYPVRSFYDYSKLSTGHKNSYSFHTQFILNKILK